MLAHRFRRLLIAILGGAALLAALLLTLWALPARAQAPSPPASRSTVALLAPTGVTTTFTYMPIVSRFLAPCTAAPAQVTPTDQTQLDNLIPDLTYLRETTAVSSSTLDLAANLSFNPLAATLFTSDGGSGPVTVHPAVNLQPATVYYWRVQDNCLSGLGPYSPVISFTTGSGGVLLPAPGLVSPISGTVGVTNTVKLIWQAVSGASGYQIWLQHGGISANLTFAGTAKFVNNLLPGTTYTWFAQGINTYAYGAESVHWTFTTAPFAAGRAGAAEAGAQYGWYRVAQGFMRR